MLKFIFFLIIINTPLHSEVSHYRNILVGDRAVGMAGAYTAISDDTSGAFYNPAGIVYSEKANGLSASANVYHLQGSKYKNAIRNNDWNRKSAELLPNFFGILKNWGKHALEFSIIIPDSFVQHQDQVFNNLSTLGTEPAIDRYVFNLHTEDATYLIGPSYAFKFNEKISIGTTLSFFYRKNRMQIHQNIWYPDLTYTSSSAITEWGEKGLAPKLGLRWSILENLKFGFLIAHTFLISSNFNAQIRTKEKNSNTSSFSELTTKDKRKTTTQLSLGLAYEFNDNFILSSNVDFYTAASGDSFYPHGYKATTNFALAGEYKITNRHIVRAGFFTNLSNMPKPTNQTRQVTHINLYGFSTGYSMHLESTSITLGIVYSTGSGESQVYENSTNIIPLSRYSLSGVLATSFKF
jgi:long-subunit fatty acid transport protein